MRYNHQDMFPYFKNIKPMSATVRNQIAHMIRFHPYDLQEQKLIDGDKKRLAMTSAETGKRHREVLGAREVHSLIQMVITWVNKAKKIHNGHISALLYIYLSLQKYVQTRCKQHV